MTVQQSLVVVLLLSPGLLVDSILELLPGQLELVDNMLVVVDAIRVLVNNMLVGEDAIRVLVDNILVGEDAIRVLVMLDNTREKEGDHTRTGVRVLV